MAFKREVKILDLLSVIHFGIHRGKTLKDIVFGIPFDQSDLQNIFKVYGSSKIDWDNEIPITLMLGYNDLAPAYEILSRKLPNPGWLINTMENNGYFIIHPHTMDAIRKSQIPYLDRVEAYINKENEDSDTHILMYRPIFTYSKFNISDKLESTNLTDYWDLQEEINNQPYDDDDYQTEHYISESCPACGNEKPCMCQYFLNRL